MVRIRFPSLPLLPVFMVVCHLEVSSLEVEDRVCASVAMSAEVLSLACLRAQSLHILHQTSPGLINPPSLLEWMAVSYFELTNLCFHVNTAKAGSGRPEFVGCFLSVLFGTSRGVWRTTEWELHLMDDGWRSSWSLNLFPAAAPVFSIY